jgi:hypothetical protein
MNVETTRETQVVLSNPDHETTIVLVHRSGARECHVEVRRPGDGGSPAMSINATFVLEDVQRAISALVTTPVDDD